ncbi:MAG: P-loop ATPase, Sll1717 family [Paracoccaceae bacterium]
MASASRKPVLSKDFGKNGRKSMSSITKLSVLQDLDIGNGVAELERELLGEFFFESVEWQKLIGGRLDLILGPKGSGKSALFFQLLNQEYELSERNILLVSSENPLGESVFSTLANEDIDSEEDFIRIWKLYFLVLTFDLCEKNGVNHEHLSHVRQLLVQADLHRTGWSLKQIFANVTSYVKSRLYFDSSEAALELDPILQTPKKIQAKFTFQNPSTTEKRAGVIAIDDALQTCNNSLVLSGSEAWILVDRLDAIFPNDRETEKRALRALVRTYASLRNLPAINPKIFLRNDIWASITKEGGFREASHLAPITARIKWSKATLAEMLLRRFLRSQQFRDFYLKSTSFVRSNSNDKLNFLYSLFPEQMNIYGDTRQKAFDWLIVYTMDGQDVNAPRDLIELMNAAIDHEITRLSRGDKPYKRRNLLFNHEGLTHGGDTLSKTKMEQTIFAEYPQMRQFIDCFIDSPSRNFDLVKLSEIWNVNIDHAAEIAVSLSEIGILKRSGKDRYLIPVLYTGYLRINPSKKRFNT